MNFSTTTWLGIAVIILLLLLFTICFNSISKLIVKVFRKLHFPPLFLVAIFKELSILGLISFILFYMATIDFISEDSKILIEEVHMLLFATTIVYIFFVFMLLFSSSTTISRLRSNVVISHNLPEEFVYYRYVRKCLQETLVHITEIDTKVWLTIEIIALLCFLTNLITGKFTKTEAVVLVLIAEIIIVILSLIMIIKSKMIVNGLAKVEISQKYSLVEDKTKRTFLNQQMKTFCPCVMKDATKTSKLFWFKSKGFFRGLIQVILLIQALSIALIILSLKLLIETSPVFGPLAIIVFLLCAIWILLFAIPYLVPVYALCAYSAESTSKSLLKQCLDKNISFNTQFQNVFSMDDDFGTISEDSISELGMYLPPELSEPFISEDNKTIN